jgi:hypothetical protein
VNEYVNRYVNADIRVGKGGRLRLFLACWNVFSAALLLVAIRPALVPLEVRAEVGSFTGNSTVALVLDVRWTDPVLGRMRLDASAIGSGPCRGWVCESETRTQPEGSHPAVLLKVFPGGNSSAQASCTGTLLADRLTVVTAAHCLSDRIEKVEVQAFTGDGASVEVASYRLHRSWDALAHDTDDGFDVAVATLASPLYGVPVAVLGDAVTGQIEAWGIQYPADRGPEMRTCRPSFDDVAVRRFAVSGLLVLMPCGLRPGASGGPVFSGTGDARRLVAVLVAVDEDGMNYVDPIGDLDRDFGPPMVPVSVEASSPAGR